MIQRLRRSSSIVGARTLIHSGSAKKLGLRTLGERSSGNLLKRSTPLKLSLRSDLIYFRYHINLRLTLRVPSESISKIESTCSSRLFGLLVTSSSPLGGSIDSLTPYVRSSYLLLTPSLVHLLVPRLYRGASPESLRANGWLRVQFTRSSSYLLDLSLPLTHPSHISSVSPFD